MDCNYYIDNILSAHADGELRGQRSALPNRTSAVVSHAVNGSLKNESSSISSELELRISRVPADLRLYIRTALGELVDAELLAQRPAWCRYAETATYRASQLGKSACRHPIYYAMPIAAVTLLMILGIKSRNFRSVPTVPATPVFSLAVNKFDSSIRDFAPNVTIQSPSQNDSDFAWIIRSRPFE